MKSKKIIRFFLLCLTMVIALGFGAISTAKAVEFDNDGLVQEGEVVQDDLFIASDTVEIEGTVKGDVFAAAGLVKVSGVVEGSLFTGAQTIILSGDVQGSIYAGASSFTLEEGASVARNLYYGGFNLTTEEGSQVGRDVLVGAYQALLSGTVGRDIQAGVGALEINGRVGGDVFAEVGSPQDAQQTFFFGGVTGVDTIVPTGIRIAEDASIGGTLTYKSSQRQQGAIDAAPEGGVTFQYDPAPAEKGKAKHVSLAAMIGSWIVQRLRVFATLLVLGGLVIWQLPSMLEKVSVTVQQKTAPTLGWGLVTILVFYISAFIIAGLVLASGLFFGIITLGGLSKTIFSVGFSSLGVAVAIFGLLVAYLSKLVVSYTAGKLLLDRVAPEAAAKLFWPMLLGIVIYVILRAIPFFGWIIGALVTLIGIGAMWLVYRDRRQIAPQAETA